MKILTERQYQKRLRDVVKDKQKEMIAQSRADTKLLFVLLHENRLLRRELRK